MFKQYQGLTVDPFDLGLVIEISAKNKDLDRAFLVLDIIKEHSMSPNLFVYNSLIRACAANHNTQKVLEVFQIMKTNKVAPNMYTFYALIPALSTAPDECFYRYLS